MGACAGIAKKKISFKLNPQVKFSFKHKEITLLSESPYRTYGIDLTETLNKYSAYTSASNTLFLVGGISKMNQLSNDVVRLNLSTLSAEYLATLPYTSKLGNLHIFENFIYYIGGVRIHNNTEYPTPFLRLEQNSSTWEILEESPRSGKKISISTQLYRPGSCYINSSIYIISGEIMIPNYNKSFNSKVYKLDLNTLEISLLNYFSPICVAPKSIFVNNEVLVFGKDLNNTSFMQKLFEQESDPVVLNFDVKDSMKLFKSSKKVVIFRKNTYVSIDPKKMAVKYFDLNLNKTPASGHLQSFINLKTYSEAPKPQALHSLYYNEDN